MTLCCRCSEPIDPDEATNDAGYLAGPCCIPLDDEEED